MYSGQDSPLPEKASAEPARSGIPTFWVASLGLALASAAWFLCIALANGPVGRSTKIYCLAAAAYAVVIGLCLASATWRARLARSTSRLVILGLSCLFCVAVLEIAARLLSPPSPFHPVLSLRPWYRTETQVGLPGVSPTSTFSTNRWGLRGDEPPARWNEYYTIVAIGGSTTQCYFLDDKKTWPWLLQEKLHAEHPKLWVGNAGLDGHSTRGHLIFMREAIPKIKPDAVILLVGMNDFSLSLQQSRGVNGGGALNDADRTSADAGDPVGRLLRAARFHSRIAQLALVWKSVLRKEVVLVNRHGQGVDDLVPLDEPARELPTDLESVLPQLPEFRENIRQIIALGRAQGVRTIFLTQPHSFRDEDVYRGQYPRYYWLNTGDSPQDTGPHWSAAQHWLLLQEYNRNLLEVCRSEQVECYDLAAAVPGGNTCFYDTVHFNEFGAELVAREVAAFLMDSDLPLDK